MRPYRHRRHIIQRDEIVLDRGVVLPAVVWRHVDEAVEFCRYSGLNCTGEFLYVLSRAPEVATARIIGEGRVARARHARRGRKRIKSSPANISVPSPCGGEKGAMNPFRVGLNCVAGGFCRLTRFWRHNSKLVGRVGVALSSSPLHVDDRKKEGRVALRQTRGEGSFAFACMAGGPH